MKHISLLFFFFIPASGILALEIPNPKQEFVAKMEDKSCLFEFKVVNNSQETESIDSVSGGCSCLSVMCNKKSLKPGESAVVTGSFDFQTNVGKQRKIIYIKTSTGVNDSDSKPLQNEYKMILEGEIPSPIKISKSALIWIDGDKIEEKKFTVTKKVDYAVDSISVERDPKGGDGDNFIVDKVDNPDHSSVEFTITPKTTDLASVSSKFRDYFCRLNINYNVTIEGKQITRTERLDLLLAKKPGKKYDMESAK